MGGSVNSYQYVKMIAEELRGLAVEFDVPIMTATQTNRNGHGNSDVDLADTSESYGLPMTLDFMFAIMVNEEMLQSGRVVIKQLKNRYSDVSKNRKFILGVDRSKMQFYDVDQHEQRDIIDGPIMDQTDFGQRDQERKSFKDFTF
jgi:hypothetical protein